MKRLLEVIVCSVEDAIAAEDGGAGRLEIVRELERGGLTPPLDLVRRILERVSIPVRAMVRESDSFEVENSVELNRLCAAARQIATLPVDGIVVGFAKGGSLDLETTSEVIRGAPGLRATFHHAFDAVDNPLDSLRRLKSLPQIDRVLTSATRGQWADLVSAAAPEITILAGGGMTEDRILELMCRAPVAEFHAGRAAREPETTDAGVSAARVRALVNAITSLHKHSRDQPDDQLGLDPGILSARNARLPPS
ncbi:MAG: copper homeostasis protein CutC [Bryobacteraceae bacterium]